MNFPDLTSLLLAAVIIVWIISRQFRWKPVDPSRMWRGPLILAAIGIYVTANGAHRLTGAEAGLLVLELVVAGASGILLGRVAELRRLTPARQQMFLQQRKRASRTPATHESRTGTIGLIVWVGLVILRAAIAAVGSHLGVSLAAEAGVIYLVIAANRAGRAAVMAQRLVR